MLKEMRWQFMNVRDKSLTQILKCNKKALNSY
jgi:hypothetical protein